MDDHCVLTRCVCVSSFVKKEGDLQIDEYIKKTASIVSAGGNREVIYFPAPRRQTWLHSFPFLSCLRNCWSCSACSASFILHHFTSNGLTFTVTEAKRISEKKSILWKWVFIRASLCLMLCYVEEQWHTEALMQSNRNQEQMISSIDNRFRPVLPAQPVPPISSQVYFLQYWHLQYAATFVYWHFVLTINIFSFFLFCTSSVFCTCVPKFHVQS